MDENGAGKEKVVIAGLTVTARHSEIYSDDATLNELEALVETAGGEVVARCLQNRAAPDPATLLGEGKVEEIAELIKNFGADLAVFDNELSPIQLKNLEEALDCAVMDRTGVILDIFADRASTAEGKLQVALAQNRYLLPRLVGRGKTMSRIGGASSGAGMGTRGPGETKLETDRRRIRGSISRLEKELEQVKKARGTQRKQRRKAGVPMVSLVGYTNAGKSTLLNALTNSDIHTADRLFDTLDPTTRKLKLEDGLELLFTDTVGFIRGLPHHLIDAFRATLEELSFADLVLNVIDASDPRMEEQAEVTEKLIAELCAPGVPVVKVFNKADRLEAVPALPPGAVAVSAVTGQNIPALLEEIREKLDDRTIAATLRLPFDKAGLLPLLYREGKVEKEEYTETHIEVTLRCGPELYGKVREYAAV